MYNFVFLCLDSKRFVLSCFVSLLLPTLVFIVSVIVVVIVIVIAIVIVMVIGTATGSVEGEGLKLHSSLF